MRWPYDYGDRSWHLWFAWHPIVVEGHWVWLERVWRTNTNCQGYICSTFQLFKFTK